MRSVRDADNNSKLWQKTKPAVSQIKGLSNSVAQLQKQVAKIRRRIVGGGSSPSTGITFGGEWKPQAYDVNVIVVISTGDNQGTFITIQSASATDLPYAGAGIWQQLPGGILGLWQ